MCHSARTGNDGFNWREVACSPECGQEYLRRVRISRGELVEDEPKEEAALDAVDAEEKELAELAELEAAIAALEAEEAKEAKENI